MSARQYIRKMHVVLSSPILPEMELLERELLEMELLEKELGQKVFCEEVLLFMRENLCLHLVGISIEIMLAGSSLWHQRQLTLTEGRAAVREYGREYCCKLRSWELKFWGRHVLEIFER